MTAAEKARMLSGAGWMESQPIERLGIPAIKMADGPTGCTQLGRLLGGHERRGGAIPPSHRVSRGHRNGVDLGRRPGS